MVATRRPRGRDRHHLRRHVGEDHAPSGCDPVGDRQAQAACAAGELEHLVAGSRRDGIDHAPGDRLGALLDVIDMLTPGLRDRAPHLVDAAADLLGGGRLHSLW